MSRDLSIHNRIVRLAVDQTSAAFACLATFDSESDSVTIGAVSGINSSLFSQINNSARRSHVDWVPSITVGATANTALETIFHGKSSISMTASEIIDEVLPHSLINSTFDQFKDHSCVGIPILINNKVYAAIVFVAPTRFLKPQLESFQAYVDKATDSLARLFCERRLTDQIEKLTQERRQIQTVDPLGLTQRTDSISRSPRSFGEIRLSIETQTATRGGRELNLTKREFDLLNTFLQSAETALSRVQIISRV